MKKIQFKKTEKGFTILELIGVLAVISILSAALAPNVINIINAQRSVNDQKALVQVAEALKLGIAKEYIFPSVELSNSATTPWWLLSARNGSGSEYDTRYANKSNSERRLYYFDDTLNNGISFHELTGDGSSGNSGWGDRLSLLATNAGDVLDLRFLRCILLSTTTDKPLPLVLDESEFEALWNNWSIELSGNPTFALSNYGLGAEWEGEASELSIERIDLGDLFCEVIIENTRTINASANQGSWTYSPVSYLEPYLEYENLIGAQAVINYTKTNGPGGSEIYASIEGILLETGYFPGNLVFGGNIKPKINLIYSSDASKGYDSVEEEAFTLNDWAQVALISLSNSNVDILLPSNANGERYQKFNFLKGQELALENPFVGELGERVALYKILKSFNYLKFDGQQWLYDL